MILIEGKLDNVLKACAIGQLVSFLLAITGTDRPNESGLTSLLQSYMTIAVLHCIPTMQNVACKLVLYPLPFL